MHAPKTITTPISVAPAAPGQRAAHEHHAGHHRARGRRAAQHAEPDRPGVQDRLREHRQQRDRPAEQHREEVEQDRAEQDLRVAR